jgi:hypothetical protein
VTAIRPDLSAPAKAAKKKKKSKKPKKKKVSAKVEQDGNDSEFEDDNESNW